MGSRSPVLRDYWGYLIEPDNTPAPKLEQLLLGLANYIVSICCCLQDSEYPTNVLFDIRVEKLLRGRYDLSHRTSLPHSID